MRFALFLFFFILGNTIRLNAQTIVSVLDGDAVGSNCAVVNEITATQYSLYQHIYPKSLINASGTISSIQFEHNSLATTPTNNLVDIYLGELNKQSFTSTTDWINSGLTLVWAGNLKAPNASSGYYTINLSTTFNYTNTNSLILVIHRRGTITNFNALSYHYYGTATANSSLALVQAASMGSYGSWAGTGSFACNGTLPSLKLGFSTCNQPTNGGLIGYSRGACGINFDPPIISNLNDANSCAPVYKWQISSSGTSWSDILPTISSSSYDPPIITQTTFFRRLSQVSGDANWVPSNTIKMSVTNSLEINNHPQNDTVYQQLGTGVFFVRTNITSGVTYQWQVSTNGGANWSNLSNSLPYSGVNDTAINIANPTYGFNNYQYRCVINAGSCGTITTNSATLSVLQNIQLTNSTPIACGAWNASVDIIIPVSNVGVLNTSTNVLRQINLSIGSSACTRPLNTYDFTLIAPNGTSLKFVNDFNATGTSVWANIKFRDHTALERVSEYNTTQQASYYPYSYGYYAIDQDGTLAPTFNGVNANGNWILRIEETSASTGIAFNNVSLFFGPDFVETDVTGNTINNACAIATCMGADNNIIIGTNNTYTQTDLNYPGNATSYPTDNACIADGCEWNGANNNSAWYYFFATNTTARITVSGTTNVPPGTVDMQLIVLDGASGCLPSGSASWTVPRGGCLDDETTGCWNAINNRDYYTVNGGGTTSGNVYANGIAFNTEFNLSNLVVGNKYFLVIDGNGGLSSTYYIEAESGCANCIFGGILPVKFNSFEAINMGPINQLIWKTSEEINNDYFQIERSSDGINWTSILNIEGAGRDSRTIRRYERFDDAPLKGINYYRIKTVSSDERISYSDVRLIKNSHSVGISIFPNPGKGQFTLSGLEKGISHHLRVLDHTGKLILFANTKDEAYRFEMNEVSPGVYFIQVDGKEYLRFVKTE
jgi:hypothetical protein